MYQMSRSICSAGWRAGSIVADVEDHHLDIRRFQNWALGNLVWNTNRGIFAEWLVGQALEVIGEDDARDEWVESDFSYRGIKIEVKASGRGQAWHQDRPSTPEFSVRPLKQTWDQQTNKSRDLNPPARVADIYVFCLHWPFPATPDDVRDPAFWKFWIVSKQTLDDQLGTQERVRLSRLEELVPSGPVRWSEIKAEVDRCANLAESEATPAT